MILLCCCLRWLLLLKGQAPLSNSEGKTSKFHGAGCTEVMGKSNKDSGALLFTSVIDYGKTILGVAACPR
jgi:hypothetical protein